VTSKEECTIANYHSKFDAALKESTKTVEEKQIAEENKGSFPTAVKSQALGMLNVPLQESAIKAFSQLQEKSVTSVIFNVDPSTEALNAVEISSLEFFNLQPKLSPEDPCYIVSYWTHLTPENSEVTKAVFILYCPDDAHPRKKMTYSTVSANIVAACKALGLEIERRVEISTISELTEKEVHGVLYPVLVEKSTFEKPKGPRRAAKK